MIAIIGCIIGAVLALIGSWGLFFLSQIKRAQITTNEEIKEMNKDIRGILVNMSKQGEQVISLAQRITSLHESVFLLEQRVLKLEQVEN